MEIGNTFVWEKSDNKLLRPYAIESVVTVTDRAEIPDLEKMLSKKLGIFLPPAGKFSRFWDCKNGERVHFSSLLDWKATLQQECKGESPPRSNDDFFQPPSAA